MQRCRGKQKLNKEEAQCEVHCFDADEQYDRSEPGPGKNKRDQSGQ